VDRRRCGPGLHAKPVALVDVGTFWDPVTRMLTELTAAGFVPEATARSLVRVSGAAEFLGLLRYFGRVLDSTC
jgi:hypothetical protein